MALPPPLTAGGDSVSDGGRSFVIITSQANKRPKAPGFALLGAVGKEVVGVAGGANAADDDFAHARSFRLPPVGCPQVKSHISLGTVEERFGVGKRFPCCAKNVIPHLITASPDARADDQPDVGGTAAEGDGHCPHHRTNNVLHGSAPACVPQSHCARHGVEEKEWGAIGETHVKQDVRLAANHPVGTFLPKRNIFGGDVPHPVAVHLKRRRHAGGVGVEGGTRQPKICLNGGGVVTHQMPEIQPMPRGSAVSAVARENCVDGVCQRREG